MHPHQPKLIFGAVICTIGYFFIALMGAFSKLVDPQVPVSTILLFQNGVAFLLNLPQAAYHGWRTLKTEKIGLHLVRDMAGVLTFFCLFFALRSIPLIDGVLLQNSAPLWIPLVVLIWLRIKMHGHLWWGMILGFAGIVLVLKPGPEILNEGSVFGVLSGIILAVSLVASRRLTYTEPTHRILFYYTLFATLATIPFAIAQWSAPSAHDWIYLSGVGLCMFIAQVLVTISFKHGKAAVLAPIAYTAVVYSGILGWLIFGHIPDWLSLFGLALVIAGGIVSLFFEKKFEKKIEKS